MNVPVPKPRRRKPPVSATPLNTGMVRAQDRFKAARASLTMRASRIRTAWRVILITLLFALAAIVWLSQTSYIVSLSYKISDFGHEKTRLDRDYEQMQSQLAQYDDLRRIDQEARTKLGMVPATNSVYVKVPAVAPGSDQDNTTGTQNVPTTEWWKELVQMLPRPVKELAPPDNKPANR